jgi:hypothetical protein
MVGKTAILIMCVAVLLSPSSACILKYVRISSYDLVLVRSNDLSPLLLLGHLVFCALQLWGWRSDLEMAARMGDVDTIRTIAETHRRSEVQEFLEMRMVLTAAAEGGQLVVCVVLVDELGCLVDGVRDPRNKPAWQAVQASSGNFGNGKGLTPLFRAVIVGHSRLASWLLSRGADPNFEASNGGGTALHFAM